MAPGPDTAEAAVTSVDFTEMVSRAAVFVCPRVSPILSRGARFWGMRCRPAEGMGQKEAAGTPSCGPALATVTGPGLPGTVLATLAGKSKARDQNALSVPWRGPSNLLSKKHGCIPGMDGAPRAPLPHALAEHSLPHT